MSDTKYEIPEILYETPSYPGEQTSPIPYIDVANGKTMPPVLFIFEYKETGEFELGDDGKPVKVIDQIPHKYVDMELLKKQLSPDLNDEVRLALGMKPLQQAQREGKSLIDKVLAKQQALKKEALSTQDDRMSKVKEEIDKAVQVAKTKEEN